MTADGRGSANAVHRTSTGRGKALASRVNDARQRRESDSDRGTDSGTESLTDVELYPITARLPTFDIDFEKEEKRRFLPRVAKRGSSLKQGVHISLSCGWLGSIHGLEYIQLYLWLCKDYCWSQLRWVYPGIIFGCLAVGWSVMLLFLSLSARLYSEAYLGIGMLLWLGANFIWMVGEFWDENFLDDPQQLFYNGCLQTSKSLAAGAFTLLTLYFVVLLPAGFFDFERKNNPVMARLCDDAPPPRFRKIFTTFREYETLHLLFWSLKDMCWVYNWRDGYVFGFAPTLILNLDLMILFASYRDQLIDFVHCINLFLWVVANGIWAYGEMSTEVPPPGISEDDFITKMDWEAYSWPNLPRNPYHAARYAAGWVFFLNFMILGAFYVYWIITTMRCPPVEDDAEDPDSDSELADSLADPAPRRSHRYNNGASTTIELSDLAQRTRGQPSARVTTL